jgi:ParB-like chromosome segregation protein Spo0J
VIRSGLVKYHDDLAPLMVDIDTIQPHPDNYNNGDVEALAESIEVNGMYRPVFVQRESNFIIAGNHTWHACKMLDADRIPVVMLDVNHAEAVKIMLADNRIASLAMPDNSQLVVLLDRLKDMGDLTGTGFNDRDHEVLTKLAEIEVDYDEFGTWPTLTFQVHPRVRAAFMELTKEADHDQERFELLLRLAGWEG